MGFSCIKVTRIPADYSEDTTLTCSFDAELILSNTPCESCEHCQDSYPSLISWRLNNVGGPTDCCDSLTNTRTLPCHESIACRWEGFNDTLCGGPSPDFRFQGVIVTIDNNSIDARVSWKDVGSPTPQPNFFVNWRKVITSPINCQDEHILPWLNDATLHNSDPCYSFNPTQWQSTQFIYQPGGSGP